MSWNIGFKNNISGGNHLTNLHCMSWFYNFDLNWRDINRHNLTLIKDNLFFIFPMPIVTFFLLPPFVNCSQIGIVPRLVVTWLFGSQKRCRNATSNYKLPWEYNLRNSSLIYLHTGAKWTWKVIYHALFCSFEAKLVQADNLSWASHDKRRFRRYELF